MKHNEMQIDLLDAKLEGREFDYEIDDDVFQQIDGLVTRGRVRSHVVCTRAHRSGYVFQIHSEGVVCVPCDRCLADVELRIDTTDELTVRLGDTLIDDGEAYIVPEHEAMFDPTLPIYEFIVLSMPIKRIHEPGMCDNAMMDVLDSHQAARSSREDAEQTDSDADVTTTDSRWDELRKLL